MQKPYFFISELKYKDSRSTQSTIKYKVFCYSDILIYIQIIFISKEAAKSEIGNVKK